MFVVSAASRNVIALAVAVIIFAGPTAHATVISNFNSVFDTATNRIQFTFDIAPVDANTPNGVDSINIDFDNLTDGILIDSQSIPFVAGSTLIYSSVGGATGEILDGDEFIVDFPTLTSPTSLAFIIGGISTAELASDPFYQLDFFVNTTAGATPSLLGQEYLFQVADQSNFTSGSVGTSVTAVAEPGVLGLIGLVFLGMGVSRGRKRVVRQ